MKRMWKMEKPHPLHFSCIPDIINIIEAIHYPLCVEKL
jgi:hypothetical protein